MTGESESGHTVIVGASAAGSSTAEGLRSRGFAGRITLIGEEPHLPYDRPPLSKQLIKGAVQPADLSLRSDAHFGEIGVGVRRGVRAMAADAHQRRVFLSDGSVQPYDWLVVATGVTPRRLPFEDPVPVIHVLRTVDDALALRSALAEAQRVVVIGGGVLGAEVTATARAMNVDVVLASPSGPPLRAVIGDEMGRQLLALHVNEGVDVRTGPEGRVRAVSATESNGASIEFEAGDPVAADLVVVAVGSVPAVSWLNGSGIAIGDGVLCDDDCSAGPGVFAVGDVARWHNRRFGVQMRIEHRTNATDQGWHVAERILAGDRVPYTPVPYFWSDQFGLRIQAHGYLRGHDEVRIVEGELASGRMIALFRRHDQLTGVVSIGAAKAARMWRAHLDDQISWRDAVALT